MAIDFVRDALTKLKLLLSKFEVFFGNLLHQRRVVLSARIRISNSKHPVHDVDGYRSDLITAFSDEALERFLDFPRWPHLQKRMTKVSGLQSFLLHHHSRDGVAANKIIFVLIQRCVLKTEMRKSVIAQLDSRVSPLLE